MQYIDSHCHLNATDFLTDIDDVIVRAQKNGVRACVVVSESEADFDRTLQLSAQYPHFIFPCLGWHPVQADKSTEKSTDKARQSVLSRSVQPKDVNLQLIREYCDKLIGIGEVKKNVERHCVLLFKA